MASSNAYFLPLICKFLLKLVRKDETSFNTMDLRKAAERIHVENMANYLKVDKEKLYSNFKNEYGSYSPMETKTKTNNKEALSSKQEKLRYLLRSYYVIKCYSYFEYILYNKNELV